MAEVKREFKVLNDIEHVLLRPNMYIGGVNLTEREQWIYDAENRKFRFGSIKFVPALLKCASELIDNCIDVAIDTNFKYATKIQVNVDSKSIEVIDNGIGIPCHVPENDKGETRTCAELAWTTLKSGTSFGENRNKIGTNGVGSSCVNVFSKLFIGESDDGRNAQTITCRNNLSEVKAGKIRKSSGKSGVRVYCEPDLERFNLTEIDKIHMDLIRQRLINLAISFPKISFYFNKEKISINDRRLTEMFSDNCVFDSGDNYTVIVFPNEYDEFKFCSFVNGIDIFKGGSHVDYISFEICSRIRDKLIKKYKSIRPADIKNKLSMAVFFIDFLNPEFDSQTKESLSNSQGDITRHLGGKLDFDKLVKNILKNDAIMNPVVETFKIKEELKARQELKQVKKIKVKSDKYMSPIGSQLNLFLCEGQSASSSLCSCLGRDGNGFYSLRGLPINVMENSIQKIAANQEFKDVMNILGLDISKNDDVSKHIAFERIVIACDQDLDGNHLSSVLIGWFRKFAPNLFKEGRICKLQTPLIIVKDQKENIREYFFDLDSFKSWEKKNNDKKLKIFYQKGLGSIERSDMKWLMENNGGVMQFLYELMPDNEAFDNIDLWLGGDADPRKEKLRQYTLDINMA